jgi:hypothetical protein
VRVPPTVRFTESLTDPVPDAVHDEPDEATHVHVALLSEAGRVSVTVAPVTFDGPALPTTIVYVTPVPGISEVAPSVLVIDRSAVRTSVLVSVEELFEAVGSVTPVGVATVAVLTSEPAAAALIVAVSK